MSVVAPPPSVQKMKELEVDSKPLRIRITLTSLNPQALEKV